MSPDNFIPPSPEARAMKRYGEIPVDLSCGLALIDIPLYEVKSRKLSVPISISYHASGIRVADKATQVGLGWVLKAGGSVNRNVVGIADEFPNGLLNLSVYRNRQTIENVSAPGNYEVFEYLNNLSNGNWDTQSDQYSFNLGMVSGSFLYDVNKNLHVLPVDRQFRITRNLSVNSFTITDDDGTIYEFNETETTQAGFRTAVTGWHLTRMISYDKVDTITFIYQQELPLEESVTRYTYRVVNAAGAGDCSQSNVTAQLNDNTTYFTYRRKLISAIQFSLGRVEFLYRQDRQDYGTSRLDAIRVFNLLGDTIRNIRFNQTYFSSGNTIDDKRMRLDSIEIGPRSISNKEKYAFGYNEMNLPPYRRPNSVGNITNSVEVDLWGYYKPSSSGYATTLPLSYSIFLQGYLCDISFCGYGGILQDYTLRSQDRTPNTYFSQACILNKIVYPTGGATKFTYEGNLVKFNEFETPVGGLRIKEVINEEPVSRKQTRITYEYPVSDAVSPGVMHDLSYRLRTVYPVSSSNAVCYRSDFFVESNPIGGINYHNGSPVIYSKVVERQVADFMSLGKTEYYFSFDQDSMHNAMEKNWTFSTSRSWLRGQLDSSIIWSGGGSNEVRLKKISNKYENYGRRTIKVGQVCDQLTVIVNGSLYNYIAAVASSLAGSYPFEDRYYLTHFDYVDVGVSYGTKKISETEETDYSYSGIISKKKVYRYGGMGHLYVTDIFEHSSIAGKIYQTQLRYPQDRAQISQIDPGSQQALDLLVSLNVLQPVIEKRVFLLTNEVGRPLTKELTKYKALGGSRIYPFEAWTQKESSAWERRMQYLQYDDFGNLREFKANDDVSTSLIWGMRGLYSVGSVKGASYDQIAQVLNTNLLLSESVTDDQVRFELNKVRYHSLLKPVAVRTFTYKPLVGLTSTVDEMGITTFYGYDKMQRLEKVLDHKRNVTKFFEYQFSR
jgi:hypothetical protein